MMENPENTGQPRNINKIILILISSIIIMLAVIAAIFFFRPSQLSPEKPAPNLETCKTLYQGNAGSTNIVFFSDEKTAKEYADYLLSIPPFSSSKDSFSFYYIDTYTPECALYKNIALDCYSKETIKTAASCPNDHIIVLKSESYNIRSSAYMNVLSINSNHPKTTFAHELAHSFGGLADEYVPAVLPKKIKNCFDGCSQVSQNAGAQCFQGCSNNELYRTVENGLMRSLSANTYGSFNEKLLSEEISKSSDSAITGSAITGNAIEENKECAQKEYYLIEGEYKNSQVSIKSRAREIGCYGKNGNGAFEYSIINADNNETALGSFEAELIFTDVLKENITEGGPITYEGSFYLKVPVISEAKKLEIKYENKKTEVNLDDIGYRPCKI